MAAKKLTTRRQPPTLPFPSHLPQPPTADVLVATTYDITDEPLDNRHIKRLPTQVQKSHLLLEAQLLRAQQQSESAAETFAEAAMMEEPLRDRCLTTGAREKAFVHGFSAASCWAQAGDFSTVDWRFGLRVMHAAR